ncbi:MAG TPA: hypothetical protein VGS99_03010, partial [Gammaproteobacteria bacterium]|nr:hypothetical protein [Gammaproteobacteria bacterium]
MLLAYLRIRAVLWLARAAARLLAVVVVVAVLVVLAPVTVVAGLAVAGAWLRGWPPARLARSAVVSLVMTAVWLAALAASTPGGRVWVAASRAWERAWHSALAGHLLAAFVTSAPVAVPAGLAAAAGLWAWRIYAIETGLTGRTATAPIVFDARQWRRQSRAARARAAAPGAVPLSDARGRVVMGTVIRTVGHRWQPVLAIPHGAFLRHQVIIGSSGSGKTNLMIRSWAGWFAATAHAATSNGDRFPLLAALDCKGGPDARAKAARARSLLYAAGARRVAIWPDEAALSLWALPQANLAVTLFQMIESGTGSAAFYADVTQS